MKDISVIKIINKDCDKNHVELHGNLHEKNN